MAYVEIDLGNVKHNLHLLFDKGYKPEEIFAVVKDDAYGCGALKVAQTLEAYGITKFVVARMAEAAELRDARIKGDILVLGENNLKELEYASSSNIHVTINSVESLRNIITSSLELTVHVNIDTGMGRLGVTGNEIGECCRLLKQTDNIHLEALFSHFSCADSIDNKLVDKQVERFENAKAEFISNDIKFSYYHFPNSAGAIKFDKKENVHTRVGILLYGCRPDPEIDPEIDLKNVMSLKAPVAMVKKIKAGDTVSYGANFIAEKETAVATIAAGYAHGIPRILTGNMEVLIRGKRFPVIGNVTMDYIMVDVGLDSWIDAGEEAVIMGCQGDECITADELALKCKTIGYEIICSVGRNHDKRFIGR